MAFGVRGHVRAFWAGDMSPDLIRTHPQRAFDGNGRKEIDGRLIDPSLPPAVGRVR